MRFIYFVITIILFESCDTKQIVHLYSTHSKEIITLIKEKNELLYVYPKYVDYLEPDGYLKLDITDLEPGIDDQMYISWEGDSGWRMVVPNSVIIENQLNENKYMFDNKLPIDYKGIPRIDSFTGLNCFEVDLDTFKKFPRESVSVVIKR